MSTHSKKNKFYFLMLLSFLFYSPLLLAKTSIQQDVVVLNKGSLQAINPKVLKLALQAQRKAMSKGLVKKKSLMTIVDYSIPSTKPRLWVVDVSQQKVIYHTHVAHGQNTGGNLAAKFSDRPGSYQSSLGVFVTGKTYQGKHGLSLDLHGLEKGFNGNAHRRRIVVHSAHYVTHDFANKNGRLGRSWGCLAVGKHVAKPLIHSIKEGSLIFAYYPDHSWLKQSAFL